MPGSTTFNGPLRVLYVEDDSALRGILSAILTGRQDLKVVATAASPAEALTQALGVEFDVALLDLAPGDDDMSGIELGMALRELRPEIGVVLLSQHQVPAFLTRFDDEQCHGWSFILKRADLPLQFAPAISGQYGDEGLRPFDPLLVVGNAFVTSLAIALILWGFSRVLPKDAEGCPSRGLYLLALLVASVVGGLLRILVLSPVLDSSPQIIFEGVIPNTARMFLSITLVQSISGMLTLRYARQAAVATAALETVVKQQRLVVEADERACRGVAEFLHDRVQADLLVAAPAGR